MCIRDSEWTMWPNPCNEDDCGKEKNLMNAFTFCNVKVNTFCCGVYSSVDCPLRKCQPTAMTNYD